MTLKDLNRQARESVVLLEILGPTGRKVGNGTGFFVEGSLELDRIATNFHVVDGAHRVEAVLADGARVEALGILGSSAESDLAVLAVARGPHPPLRLSAAPPAEPGDPVVVLGNPLGLSGSLSTGIVSAVRERGVAAEIDSRFEGAPRIQITAAISPGSSGSPVLDAYGEVIGVAVSQILAGQSLNFAVPVEDLVELLQTIEARGTEPESIEPGGSGAERFERRYGAGAGAVPWVLVRNLLISALVFLGLVLGLRRLR